MKKEISEKKSLKQRAKEKAKKHAKEFRGELRKAIKTAFIAAFGFLIALVWRDLIVEYVNKVSETSPVQGKLISALIITLLCVIGILIFTRLFSEKEDGKK